MLLLLASDASDFGLDFPVGGTIRLPRVREVDGLSRLEIGNAAKSWQVSVCTAKAGKINHSVVGRDFKLLHDCIGGGPILYGAVDPNDDQASSLKADCLCELL